MNRLIFTLLCGAALVVAVTHAATSDTPTTPTPTASTTERNVDLKIVNNTTTPATATSSGVPVAQGTMWAKCRDVSTNVWIGVPTDTRWTPIACPADDNDPVGVNLRVLLASQTDRNWTVEADCASRATLTCSGAGTGVTCSVSDCDAHASPSGDD